jgi:hypothetical protein
METQCNHCGAISSSKLCAVCRLRDNTKPCVHCGTLTQRIHVTSKGGPCMASVCLGCAESHYDDHKRGSYLAAYRRYLLKTGQIQFTTKEA